MKKHCSMGLRNRGRASTRRSAAALSCCRGCRGGAEAFASKATGGRGEGLGVKGFGGRGRVRVLGVRFRAYGLGFRA
jgi:hypothetical protein